MAMEINAIYEGDNLEIMSKFSNDKIDMIYADPPFFSNKQYEVIWNDGAEVRAFEDRWKGGIYNYKDWMEKRLRECYRVLKVGGSMYLHCDYHAVAQLRICMDDIFGEHNFQNEVIWYYHTGGGSKRRFQKAHDNILFYTKEKDAKTFNWKDIKFQRTEKSLIRAQNPKGARISAKDLYKIPEDVLEIQQMNPMAKEREGYPTQKPVELLEKLVALSSNKEDIVFDPFCGCGTTLVASQRLERRWIGIDISPTACKLMKDRLRRIFGVNANLIKGKVDMDYIKNLPHFEFQNWVVVGIFGGSVSRTKSGDMGIDGLTPQIHGGFPIQVKQSSDIGRNPIDNFETAMRRMGKKKGYFVAYNFGKGAYEEVARAKNQDGIEIILRTAQDLLDGKIE